jgi:hypothetical protein
MRLTYFESRPKEKIWWYNWNTDRPQGIEREDGSGKSHGNIGNVSNGVGYGYGNGTGNGRGNGDGGTGYGHIYVALDPIIAWHSCNIGSRYGKYTHGTKDITYPSITTALNAGENIAGCEWGLHACERQCLALFIMKNHITTKVRCSGTIAFDSDKLVCEHREVVEIL